MFVENTKSLPDLKFLIVYGHSESIIHISIRLIELVIEHHIHMVCLPLHATHILHPLDEACFKTIKQVWSDVLPHFLGETGTKV